MEAAKFLLKRDGSGAVRATTGAGKTMIAMLAASEIEWKRMVVAVRLRSALKAWQRNLEKFGFVDDIEKVASETTVIRVLDRSPAAKRAALWRLHADTVVARVRKEIFGEWIPNPGPSPTEMGDREIIICSYATLVRDAELVADDHSGVDLIVLDESHAIRNRQTKTFAAMKKVCRRRRTILLTATPQSKGPQDLWTTLHLLAPKGFKSYWKFVNRYCVVEDGEYGKSIVGAKKSTISELRERLSDYVFNIPEKVMKGWVPDRVREPLRVELGAREKRVYRSLKEDMLATMPDGALVTSPSVLGITTKLRQLLTCPKLIHEDLGYGTGIEAIVDHALENDPHFVLFSDFVSAFPHFREYLEQRGVRHIFELRGGMSPGAVETQIVNFERHKDAAYASVLMCSNGFAESFDLLTAKTAYHLGFSWDQNVNYQAEGRLTRGQKTHCNFFYVVHERTVDTYMLEVLDSKVRASSVALTTDWLRDAL